MATLNSVVSKRVTDRVPWEQTADRGGNAVSALRSGRTAFLHRAQQGLSVPRPPV